MTLDASPIFHILKVEFRNLLKFNIPSYLPHFDFCEIFSGYEYQFHGEREIEPICL